MKKTLSILLTVIMALSMITVAGTASAAESATVNGVNCSVGNTVKVTYALQTPGAFENFQGNLVYSEGLKLVDFAMTDSNGVMVNDKIDGVVYYSGSVIENHYDYKAEKVFYTATLEVAKAGAQTAKNTMEYMTGVDGKDYFDDGENKASVVEKLSVEVLPVAVNSVVLDKTTATVEAGKTVTLTATVGPELASDKTVAWTSSDNAVATVSNGVVKGVKAGTAVITAKAGEVSATCTVTVTAIPVTSVKLNRTSATLYAGKTTTLKATVAPSNATDKTVKWSTSNKAVATVTSTGVVKAIKNGTAVITAKAGTKSASCKVVVKTLVSKVSLSKTAIKIFNGKTYTLKATVAPSSASNKAVKWTTTNSRVATVTSRGVVKGVRPGTAYVKATAVDGSKKYAQCRVTVSAQKVTKVALNKYSASLAKKGAYTTIKATVSPSNAYNKYILVSNSNKSVVRVYSSKIASGQSVKVVAQKRGSATIKFTAADGSRKYANCKVTVRK